MYNNFFRNVLNCFLGVIYILFLASYFIALFDERLQKEWVIEEAFYMQSKFHYIGFVLTNFFIFLFLLIWGIKINKKAPNKFTLILCYPILHLIFMIILQILFWPDYK